MLNIYQELKKEFQIPSFPTLESFPGGKKAYCFYMFSNVYDKGGYRFTLNRSIKDLFQFLYQIIFTDKLYSTLSLFLKNREHYKKCNVSVSKLETIMPNISEFLSDRSREIGIVGIEIGDSCEDIAKVCDFKTYKLARVRFELLRLRLILEIIYVIVRESLTLKPSNI